MRLSVRATRKRGLVGRLVTPTHRAGATRPATERMRDVTRRSATLAALAFALAALAGPSLGSAARTSAAAQQLHVDLAEWAVVPSQGHVSSGRLRLTVQNYGVLRHELDIIPTAWWGQKLFVRDGRADGAAVTRPILVAPGQTRSVHIYLQPGSYVLLDNIRGHYAAGAAVSIIAS
jgi:uncharacterized cupredoxin-like copper-binding protein